MEPESRWGDYPGLEQMHPARTIKSWKRARWGDTVVVAMNPAGRRFFVFADDPEVGVRMPVGTVLRFDNPYYVSGGYSDGGNKAPGGYLEGKQLTVIYGLTRQDHSGGRVTRPTFEPRGKWAIMLGYVRTAQCAAVMKLPRRRKVRAN